MKEPSGNRRTGRAGAALAGALLTVRALRSALRRRPATTAPPPQPPTAEDPSERTVPSNRRAENVVGALLIAAGVFGFGFTLVYVAFGASTQWLGVTLGGALALLAVACVIAGKLVVPQETSVEQRDLLYDEQESEQVADMIEAGGEGISRRGLLAGAAGLAGAGLVTAAATPLASLGPNLDTIHNTPWYRGRRLVDTEGKPYTAEEIIEGTFYTALPEGANPEEIGSPLIVVRLAADYIHLPAARRTWAPDGILAYSKICPHAGCAISLYRYPTYQPTSNGPAFTCPCHYSTFLPGEGGRVVFGPAGRSLPQLPLMVDASGHLRAAGRFQEDVGPSWWGVRRSESS